MIGKIINGDNVDAQEDFASVLANKVSAALDTRKQELAQSIYTPTQEVEVEVESEEETEQNSEPTN